MGLSIEFRRDRTVKDRLSEADRPDTSRLRMTDDMESLETPESTLSSESKEHKATLRSSIMAKLEQYNLVRMKVR
eukprot:368015-Hanusia_phi.AAC.1